MVGVTIIGLLVIAYVTGTIQMNLPTFGTSNVGGATAHNFAQQAWNNTMSNLTASSQSAFSLTGVIPMVIGAGLIIGILVSVFYFKKE